MEQAVIHSPLGPLTLFAEDDHLTALVYGDYGSYDDLPLFREAKRQLEAYFAGQRQAFSLPLNPDGTAFQRRVWQSLCDIPYGRVISYRELAAQVGSPRAFQAVGQANGRNPLPILIPCHRVIAADGTLGGYSSGVERKRFLLRLEGLSIPESKPPRRVGKRGVRARSFPKLKILYPNPRLRYFQNTLLCGYSESSASSWLPLDKESVSSICIATGRCFHTPAGC
ncbi:MAG: methylated-DNA--[protein]-cysteine S-methyltransferase [Evtepia gabavorous]